MTQLCHFTISRVLQKWEIIENTLQTDKFIVSKTFNSNGYNCFILIFFNVNMKMETRLSMKVIQSYAKSWFHLKNDCLILFSSTVILHIYYNWKTVIFVLKVSCFIQFGIRGMPWYCVSSQNYNWHIVNPLHATGLFLLLFKNIRKPEGFWCFQEL